MPDLNLGDLSTNASALATQLLDQLKADVLANLTDPDAVAMAERATATLATVPALVILAPDDATRADLQNQWDAGLAVLYSLASAAVEDAAHAQQAVRARVFAIVSSVIGDAVRIGFGALKIALV